MRKKLVLLAKAGVGLAVFAAAVLAVGTFALKRYLPPEKARSLILENSKRFINREVRLQGLDLSVLNGLEITGLEISESPDFKAGTFAAAQAFHLRVRLLPLLHATVAVDRVALDGLRLTVRKGADGLFNFSDLTASKPSATAAPAKALPLILDIRHAELDDARISYRDAGTGDSLDLTELSAKVSDLSLTGDIRADFSFKAAGALAKKPIHASVSFSGSIDPGRLDLDKVSVTMEKASVEVPEGKVQVSGTVKGARSPELDLKTEVALRGLEAVTAEVSGKLVDISSSAPSAALSVKAHTPAFKAGELKAYGAPDGLPLPSADMDGAFVFAGDVLTLKSLNVKTKGASADVSGTISAVRTKPVPALEVKAKLAFPALKAADLAFLKGYNVAVPDALSLPPVKIDADLSVAADEAVLRSLHLETDMAAVDVSGPIHKLKSAPDPDLTVTAKLKIPAFNTSELAFLKAYKVPVPEGLPIRAFDLDSAFHARGDRLDLKSLRYRSDLGTVDVSGTLTGVKTGNPAPDLTVAATLKLPKVEAGDLAFLKQYKVAVPAALSIPAAALDTEFHFQGEQVEFKGLHLKTEAGTVDASGTVSRLKSGKPQPDVTIAAKLRIPRLGPADLALLKAFGIDLPPEVTVPAADVEAEVRLQADAAEVRSLRLNCSGSSVSASGKVSGLASGKFEPAFDVAASLKIPQLTSADVSFLKAFKVSVPAEMTLPATAVEAKLHYTPEEISVSAFELKNLWATAKASGRARKIRSGKPEGSVDGALALHIPKVTARDLAVLKLIPSLTIPESLSWPASEAEAQFSFNGIDLELEGFHVSNKLVDVDARGKVRKVLTAPEPQLDLKVKTDLPAFTSADIAFVPGVPANLKFPASHFEAALRAEPDKISLKALDLHTAGDLNALSVTESGVAGFRGDNPFIVLHIDGKFNLDELKTFLPEAQSVAGLTGSGRLVNFSLTGHVPKGQKPNVGINGKVSFSGLGATVAGLPLADFSGDFDFDDKKLLIDSKNIKGKIGAGVFEMDLTVRNFNSPVGGLAVEMQKATLTQFDVGAFLAAKASLLGRPAKPAPAAAGAAVEIKPFSFKVIDGLTIGRLVHPYAMVENANLKCDLTGITPDFKKLDGTALFKVGGGHLLDLDRIAGQYPIFKVLTIPILVMRGIGIFPNLKDIGFSEVTGDYKIDRGLVVINEFHLNGDKLQVRMNRGQIDLPRDKVDLDVWVKAGVMGLNKVICGSISNPDTKCVSGELKKVGTKVIEDGAKKLLNSVFK